MRKSSPSPCIVAIGCLLSVAALFQCPKGTNSDSVHLQYYWRNFSHVIFPNYIQTYLWRLMHQTWSWSCSYLYRFVYIIISIEHISIKSLKTQAIVIITASWNKGNFNNSLWEHKRNNSKLLNAQGSEEKVR